MGKRSNWNLLHPKMKMHKFRKWFQEEKTRGVVRTTG